MKIVLLGGTGQVGWQLQRTLSPLGEVVAPSSKDVDLTRARQLREYVHRQRPQVIVNAAGYTDVDRAEREPELAAKVNAEAPGILAEAASEVEAALIHYSTDYVFDGQKGEPYVEADPPHPLNRYGSSKLAGEHAIEQAGGGYLILRTSWVYDLRGANFVTKVLDWAASRPKLRIASDQVGSPTWSRSLAEATALLLGMGRPDVVGWLRERTGVYHLAGRGGASRFEWATAILELDPDRKAGQPVEVEPARAEEFPAPAARPAYSALSCARFEDMFGLRLPHWRESLALAMEDA